MPVATQSWPKQQAKSRPSTPRLLKFECIRCFPQLRTHELGPEVKVMLLNIDSQTNNESNQLRKLWTSLDSPSLAFVIEHQRPVESVLASFQMCFLCSGGVWGKFEKIFGKCLGICLWYFARIQEVTIQEGQRGKNEFQTFYCLILDYSYEGWWNMDSFFVEESDFQVNINKF